MLGNGSGDERGGVERRNELDRLEDPEDAEPFTPDDDGHAGARNGQALSGGGAEHGDREFAWGLRRASDRC